MTRKLTKFINSSLPIHYSKYDPKNVVRNLFENNNNNPA